MKRFLVFAAAVAIQLALLAAIPWPQVRARTSGTEVILATAQYDPYDAFRGHYVALNYELARVPSERLADLPDVFYIGIRPDAAGIWRPVGEASEPGSLPPATVAVKARNLRWAASIGMDRYYMPEARRDEVNAILADAFGETDAIRVRARIGPDGTAAIIGLIVREREFTF